MCNKAVYNYSHALEFVESCQYLSFYNNICSRILYDSKMCDKAVNRCFLYFILFLINTKLWKCVTELFLKTLFLITYCTDKYKSHRMCDEAVEDK